MPYAQSRLLAFSLAGLLLSSAVVGFHQESVAASAQEINSQTQAVLSDFRAKVPQGRTVLQNAKGLLVFPHLYKGGIIVGGRYGEGELLVNNQVNGYYRLMGLSWGLQLGGQRQALIIAFMTDNALNSFIHSSGWDLGADATVAVIDAGTQGSLSAARMNKPVLAFALDQKGLMAGVSLQGSKVSKITK